MHVRLLTLRYSPSLGAFDDSPLQELIRDKEVLDFREHFFCVSDVPHVLCVVTWQRAVERDGGGVPAGERPDPRAQLSERERALFETLRSWRAEKAQKEGVPPYVILTNKQLAAVVKARPESATALGHVPGVGPGKVKRYGTDILHLLNGSGQPTTEVQAAPTEASS